MGVIYNAALCGCYLQCRSVWVLFTIRVCVGVIYNAGLCGCYLQYETVWVLFTMQVCVGVIHNIDATHGIIIHNFPKTVFIFERSDSETVRTEYDATLCALHPACLLCLYVTC